MLLHFINQCMEKRKNLSSISLLFFLGLVSIILLSNSIVIFANTPEAIPSSSETGVNTPEASTPTSTPRPGCSLTVVNPVPEAELTFFIDENSLVLYLDEPDPVDLSELGFEYSINGVRSHLCLRDLSVFNFLLSTPMTSPVCLRLIEAGTNPVLPQICDGLLIDQDMSPADIFWHGRNPRSFLVLNGNEQVDFCGTLASGICHISLGEPLPMPSNRVTIHLAWGLDYLAVYVEDPGLFDLTDLRITDSAKEDGSLLQEETAFESLRFDEIIGPICFLYRLNDSTPTPPGECDDTRRIIEDVSESNIFWNAGGVSIPLWVLVANVEIETLCFSPLGCTRHIP